MPYDPRDNEMVDADERFRPVRFGTGPIHVVELPERRYALCGHVTPTSALWPLLEVPDGADSLHLPIDELCRLCWRIVVTTIPKPSHW